jgi:formylmethanofuran dehydrogenase subunit E
MFGDMVNENPMVLYDEPKMIYVTRCTNCHEDISLGYDYYDIDGLILCEDCAHEWFEQFRRTAEID